MSTHVDSDLLITYENLVGSEREKMKKTVEDLCAGHPDPKFWYKFLITYCAQGVHMTKDVPAWISRAGEKAVSLGQIEFGEILKGHAKHEDGHHELFHDDVESLSKQYEMKFGEKISKQQIPWNPPFDSVKAYVKLHEDIIASNLPLRQAALEFEIEMLSVTAGAALIGYLTQTCGKEILPCLSFLTEHVAADVGHTKFNKILLNRILLTDKSSVDKFVSTGKEALQIYARFLVQAAEYASHKL